MPPIRKKVTYASSGLFETSFMASDKALIPLERTVTVLTREIKYKIYLLLCYRRHVNFSL